MAVKVLSGEKMREPNNVIALEILPSGATLYSRITQFACRMLPDHHPEATGVRRRRRCRHRLLTGSTAPIHLGAGQVEGCVHVRKLNSAVARKRGGRCQAEVA